MEFVLLLETDDVEALSRATISTNNVFPEDGSPSLLHWMANSGAIRCLDHLLDVTPELKAKIDVRDKETGGTALMWACGEGFADFAEKLMKAGADVNLVDNNGETALHYAALAGRDECVGVILAQPGLESVNVKSKGGNTALHLCSINNHGDCIALLCDFDGIDTTIRNAEGSLAVELTTDSESKAMFEPEKRKIDKKVKLLMDENNRLTKAFISMEKERDDLANLVNVDHIRKLQEELDALKLEREREAARGPLVPEKELLSAQREVRELENTLVAEQAQREVEKNDYEMKLKELENKLIEAENRVTELSLPSSLQTSQDNSGSVNQNLQTEALEKTIENVLQVLQIAGLSLESAKMSLGNMRNNNPN